MLHQQVAGAVKVQ